MQITYRAGSFRASAAHDPVLMQKLGWVWFSSAQEWRTSHIVKVLPFADFCVADADKRVRPMVEKRRAEIAASVAATADMRIPVGKWAADKGFDFRGYQKAGISFMTSRRKSLNGDVPRLGKMIQSIGVINTKPIGEVKRVLVIAPANAKVTWCERWPQWGVHPLAVDYCEGGSNPKSPFLVINWDILGRHADYLWSQDWDIVIADEVHRLGNPKSQRTQVSLGEDFTGIPARMHWLMLSGNPLGTKAVNLWPIARFQDPEGLGANYWRFIGHYCGASKANGWDTNGSSNEEELQYKMRSTFMVRRDKFDVGEELPANRQTIRLPKDGLTQLIRAERSAVQNNLADFEALVRAQTKEASAHAESVLGQIDMDEEPAPDTTGWAVQDLALAALPMMIKFIKEQRETEDKVVIGCHHREVAKRLRAAFPGCAFVIGGMSTTKREAERKRFQEDPDCHEFVGNIGACCENLELSAADVVICCELVWQTWMLDQFEERPWLPGKTTPIQIFRLVVADSASADMADLLELRQDSIERATVARRSGIAQVPISH